MAGVVVIGSGLAGYGVLRELRKLDKEAPLTLIAADSGDFYSKPMLSTALAKGKLAAELITTPAAKMADQLKLTLLPRTKVERIDLATRTIVCSGSNVTYDKLILALGAEPIRVRLGGDAADAVLSVNDLDDYIAFREHLEGRKHIAMIGAGLVGSELANDLTHTGYRVTVIDPLATPMAALLPPDVGVMLRDALQKQGVDWCLGRSVKTVDRGGEGYVLGLSDGSTVQADMVLSAVGLRSRTGLASTSGLEVNRGIMVDLRGRTSDPDVFAIGDCAEYPTGLAHFITPIMSAARGIAKSILGNPADIVFPVLSVIVKTTALPISLLKPSETVQGEWVKTEDGPQGTVHLFRTADGVIAGYVLTGEKSEQRPEFDAMVREQLIAA